MYQKEMTAAITTENKILTVTHAKAILSSIVSFNNKKNQNSVQNQDQDQDHDITLDTRPTFHT